MIKKSKLQRYDILKLSQISQKETIAQNISNCLQLMRLKNQKNIQKKQQLKRQIQQIRATMKRIIYDMNDSTNDRIDMKIKIIMDKNSRPQKNQIKSLADLYTLMQRQSKLTNRNMKQTELLNTNLQNNSIRLKQRSQFVGDYSDLDEQYYQLNEQCARQQLVRDAIVRQRDEKRRFYESIQGNIEQCRVEYEIVEQKIRDAQRQLIQLSGYYQNRKQEEIDQIEELKRHGSLIQDKILKAQGILKDNQVKRQDLDIRQIQSNDKNSL